MSLSDHIDIIGTVTNSHCNSFFVLIPDHLHNLSFLLWTHPARQHHVSFLYKANELWCDLLVAKDFLDSVATDNHTHLAFGHIQILLVLRNTDLLVDVHTATAINNILVNVVIQKVT